MPVAAQYDHAVHARVTDKLEKPLALGRKVGLFLESVIIGNPLDTGDDEPQIGRDAHSLVQPCLLRVAQQGRVEPRVGGQLAPGAAVRCRPDLQRTSKKSCVRQDDLDASVNLIQTARRIGAGT